MRFGIFVEKKVFFHKITIPSWRLINSTCCCWWIRAANRTPSRHFVPQKSLYPISLLHNIFASSSEVTFNKSFSFSYCSLIIFHHIWQVHTISNINLDFNFLSNAFDDNSSPKSKKAPDKCSAILKKIFIDFPLFRDSF